MLGVWRERGVRVRSARAECGVRMQRLRVRAAGVLAVCACDVYLQRVRVACAFGAQLPPQLACAACCVCSVLRAACGMCDIVRAVFACGVRTLHTPGHPGVLVDLWSIVE
jgi:hypothetical protein